MSTPKTIAQRLVVEGERVMRICNACRYCEGFCAVFPAMERRITFGEKDLNYLANLCHNCTECYYACQYAPPQEFELNFPKTLAEIRMATYEKYVWPSALAATFKKNGLATGVATVLGVLFILAVVVFTSTPGALHTAYRDSEGAFYGVISHTSMVLTFGAVAAFVLLAFAMGFARFWKDTSGSHGAASSPEAFLQAIGDCLSLKYLDGTDSGCAYPDEHRSTARRTFHHLTFYGFFLCFGATAVGTIFHYALGWQGPAPIPTLASLAGAPVMNLCRSLPVILGSLGGIGLLIGPVGLLWLKSRRNALLADREQNGMDAGFLVLLFLTSLTGFLLTAFRQTSAVAPLVALHLGVVLGLFLTMPYGKFVHGIYRFGALVKNALEQRTMPKLGAE